MSSTPVVRKPNCAGSAPVMSEILSIESRREFLAEPGDSFRQQDIIDAVLQISVLSAQVKLAEGILGDARKAQNRLVKGSILALGLLCEAIGPHGVTRGAEARDDLFARNVELLAGDDDAVRRRRSR